MTAELTNERIDKLEEALVSVALKHNWQHKYAKFGKQTQSLFVHSVNAISVARIIGDHLFDLAEDDMYLVCLSAFLHDYQKADDEWQKAALDFMEGGRPDDSKFKHDDGSKEAKETLHLFLEQTGAKLDGENLTKYTERILTIIVYTHDSLNSAESTKRKQQVGPIDPLTRIVRLCDSIASIKNPKDIIRKIKDPDLPHDKNVSFEYHELTVIRGVVSSVLNEAAIELMKEAYYIPLLYFGNGAVYMLIEEEKIIENPRIQLLKFAKRKFKEFQDSDAYQRGMSNAVIGPLTQTKWPCLHLIREQDIPSIVRYIADMPATNKKESFGETYFEEQSKKSKEHKEALEEFVKLTGSSSATAILSEMVSDFNVLVYIFDFIKSYREFITDKKVSAQYEEEVNASLNKHLGDFSLESISGITNTSTAMVRTLSISQLWKIGSEDLHLKKNRRNILVKKCISILKKIVKKYRKHAPPLLTEGVSQQLLSDLSHLPEKLLESEGISKLSSSISSRYAEGKQAKERLCNLCGNEGVEDAPAGLFGDGSEKFTNFLPGGIKLGKGKKALVCDLCMLEATLRAFYFPSSPFGTIYILPDLSISPTGLRSWSRTVDESIKLEHLGLSYGKIWNMLDVYKALARGEVLDSAESLIRHLRLTKNEHKELVKFLEDKRGEFHDEVEFESKQEHDKFKSFDELAKAHVKGIIEIDPYLIEEYSPKALFQRSSLFTSSYAITFLRNPPTDDRDESPSTTAIRTFLLGLIVAEMFHARVVFVPGYQPLETFSFQGRVSLQIPTPAENAMRNMGVDRIVKLHNTSKSLRRLASLVLITMSFVTGLGKDRLLRLMSMNRGAILRRAQMESGGEKKSRSLNDLLELLDNLPAKAGIM